MEKRKEDRWELRFLVAVFGLILVPLEWMLSFHEIALYQLLICSVYLLLNILFEVSAKGFWIRKLGRTTSDLISRFVGGAILVFFWEIFNLLLAFVEPWVSQEVRWLTSITIVMVSVLTVSVFRFFIDKRNRKTKHEVGRVIDEPTWKKKRRRRPSFRMMLVLSSILMLTGIALTYLASFTSVLDKYAYGVLQAQVFAMGVTFTFMGITLPVVRFLQDRSRRLKRVQRALRRTTETET